MSQRFTESACLELSTCVVMLKSCSDTAHITAKPPSQAHHCSVLISRCNPAINCFRSSGFHKYSCRTFKKLLYCSGCFMDVASVVSKSKFPTVCRYNWECFSDNAVVNMPICLAYLGKRLKIELMYSM